MGMDPLSNNEDIELTIVLEGPIKKAKLREFQKAVNNFLDACEAIDDGMGGGRKLQVRTSRFTVRKRPV